MKQARTINEVVDGWIALQYAHGNEAEKEALFWAYEEMWNLVAAKPDLALEVIERILKKDGSDTVVENLSAGPLENLLGGHGRQIIDAVEKLAGESAKFRTLLGGVWPSRIDRDIWVRVLAIRDRSGWDGQA